MYCHISALDFTCHVLRVNPTRIMVNKLRFGWTECLAFKPFTGDRYKLSGLPTFIFPPSLSLPNQCPQFGIKSRMRSSGWWMWDKLLHLQPQITLWPSSVGVHGHSRGHGYGCGIYVSFLYLSKTTSHCAT